MRTLKGIEYKGGLRLRPLAGKSAAASVAASFVAAGFVAVSFVVATLVVAVGLVVVVGQGTALALTVPLLSNQVSASQASAADPIYDSAMLGSGVNPTGAITFKVFGPADPTCAGTPVFTTATAVKGNGYYESSRFTPMIAGTYRWVAVYGGDATNPPSLPTKCGDPVSMVLINKRVAVLAGLPSLLRPTAVDTATLTLGAAPTGTMVFNLYGPDNATCAGAAVFTSTQTVSGNGTYSSAPVGSLPRGAYRWVVGYSGDANNVPRTTACADLANGFTVWPAVTVSVSVSPLIISRGGTMTVSWSAIASPTSGDWIGLYKVGSPDGGAVATWTYTNGQASGSLPVKVPWVTTAGLYEVRLMANNTTRRLASAGPVTLLW